MHLSLGPRPPARRLQDVLESVGATCILRPGDGGPGRHLGRVADLPIVAEQISPAGRPTAAVRGAFYAVATSGSTGVPKVVLVPGSALAGLVSWYADRCGIGPADRVSLAVNTAFDPHLKEMWTALSTGAALEVPPADVLSSPFTLAQWWEERRITLSILPTPLAELVLSAVTTAPGPLRWLVMGGDRLRLRPSSTFGARVLNCYGPAEATIATTCSEVGPGGGSDTPIPIGRPLPGWGVLVATDDGVAVPHGDVGELLVFGSGLALGYAGEELTEQAFVHLEHPDGLVRRTYRTGDLARMRPDGVLEFVGRRDAQVKVDGVRIEPAEVERALERHPAIERAVVSATVPDRASTVRITAAYTSTSGTPVAPADLDAHLRSLLPPPAVPGALRFVPDLPLTDNGKVDHTALDALVAGDEPAPSAPGLLGELAAVFEELTGQRIAHGESLVEAGANSITVARFITTVRERLGHRLRPVEVMRADSLAGVAALIEADGSAA